MEDTRGTLSDWLQFLLEAGIPASQAANYAVNFVENRITRSMLSDLDKDYLKELGVTVLGDVIAILKHSKKVSSLQPKKSEIQMIRTADGVKKSTPASRLVDHYLKSNDSNPPSPIVSKDNFNEEEDDDVVVETPQILEVSTKKSKLRSERITPATANLSGVAVTRRRVASPIVIDKLEEVVPVPKKRRVLPEHEGGYKIKMPAGTIPKTARLAAQGKLSRTPKTAESKGVFGRLGSSVSQNQEALNRNPAVTKSHIVSACMNPKDDSISFTVTGLGKVNPQCIVDTVEPSNVLDKGVFRRLGGASSPKLRRTIKRPATSTQSDEPIALDAAPYIGVLKDGGKHARPKQKIKLAASAADKTGFSAARLATQSAKKRLGQSKVATITRSISNTPTSGSVKKRLGAPSDSTVSSSTDQSSSAIRVSSKSAARQRVTFPSTPASNATSRLHSVNKSTDVFSRLGGR